eukprot:GHVR01042761.1.p1 GENE.GHVR01042761.1~~GHVR01042761.1.p1  ORF type:complete len:273 (+),score=55.74 GHVR01042761.1:134-952(+)
MNPHKVNQDAHFELESYGGDPTQYFFCVMDGHGLHGREVSDLIRRKLPYNVQNDPSFRTDPKQALTKGFLKTNSDLQKSTHDIAFSGSTTVGVYIKGTTLYCANVGDSRAVIGQLKNGIWETVNLSIDHKPDRPDEMKRIIAHNGRVEPFRSADGEAIGPPRVWLKQQDAPGLAMSRSLGDSVAASVGVLAEPEIKVFNLEPVDKFMIIASDGVWEFISSEESVRMLQSYWEKKDPKGACEYMIQESNRRWRQEEEVIDDSTCVLVFFNIPE